METNVQKLYLNIWANFFYALIKFTGWSEDTINTLVQNLHSVQNLDALEKALTAFYTTGVKPNLTLAFYINTGDQIMQDAIPTEDPTLYTSEEAFYYNAQDTKTIELLDHIYTDSLTGIQFNCYID